MTFLDLGDRRIPESVTAPIHAKLNPYYKNDNRQLMLLNKKLARNFESTLEFRTRPIPADPNHWMKFGKQHLVITEEKK